MALLGLSALAAPAAMAQSLEYLEQLSLEDLSKIEITSVSKTAEPVSDAAAAIYVITHDDIVRSGATRIAEMLRLAPNLQVAQTSASNYVITARGLSGNVDNQNLPNKLLVLIDGRSVYTPLYSGVYWDMQDLLPADIDRIEVISGPGATLWGANAVNGVINITTRKAADTQGGLLDIDGGNLERGGRVRYGGRLNADATYRVYAMGFHEDALDTPAGTSADDDWSKTQAGFRIDAKLAAEAVTLQGDVYRSRESQLDAADQLVAGGNLLARWQHQFDTGSALQVQAYYDQTQRFTDDDSDAGFVIRTYDLAIQHSFAAGRSNEIVWGAGERVNRYQINNTDAFLFDPASRTLTLGNIFAQDSIALGRSVKLILGTKFEDDPYDSGLTPLPSARLSWKVTDTALLWSAVSRAVRSPTPFDRDVVENLGPVRFLTGGSDFKSEKLTAYELGYRGRPSASTTLSISTYYNVYDDLRSVEFTPATLFPLQWGNGMKGDTYGVEMWGSYQVSSWWRLDAGFNALHEDLRFKNSSAGSLGLAGFPGPEQAGSDPRHQASLRSSMNLAAGITLDADLRYVGARPDPAVSSYRELNLRLGWSVSKSWAVSVSGFNLLHAQHQEYTEPTSDAVKRSVLFNSRWSF